MTDKNTICLWFDGTAADAAQFVDPPPHRHHSAARFEVSGFF